MFSAGQHVVAQDTAVAYAQSRTDLQEWEGIAADSFREYFAEMEDAVGVCAEMIAALDKGIEAHGEVVEGMQEDLTGLVDAAIDGLHQARMSEVEVGLAVVNAFGSIGGGALGGPVGIVAGAIAGATAVGSAVISASSELDVMRELAGALETLRELVKQQAIAVGRGFDALAEYQTKNLPMVQPESPALVTQKAFDPDDFALDLEEFEAIKPHVSTDPAVEEPEKLLDIPIVMNIQDRLQR